MGLGRLVYPIPEIERGSFVKGIANNQSAAVFVCILLICICIFVFAVHYLNSDQSEGAAIPSATSSSRMSTGEIAYISNRSGLAEIWLLDLATGTERQLTETDCSHVASTGGYVPEDYVAGVQYFTWSPDGSRIAYLTTCAHVTSQARLNVYDLETGSTISIAIRASESSYPSWSPSGDRFVFTLASHLPRRGIYIAKLDGPGEVEIEPIAGTARDECLHGCYFAEWAPDGQYIAYRGPYVRLRLPGAGSRTYVSIVDLDGNHIVYGTAGDFRVSWIHEPAPGGLAWSRDSHYLAIATMDGYTVAHLVLAEITDGEATMAEAFGIWQHSSVSAGLAPFGPGFRYPVFSPDGETLYFVSLWPDSEDIRQSFGTIYSIPTQDLLGDSSPNVQIISPEDQLAGFPSLSPDGKWLLYVVKEGAATEIWIQATDGTYRQRLVGDGFINTRPAWRPSGG